MKNLDGKAFEPVLTPKTVESETDKKSADLIAYNFSGGALEDFFRAMPTDLGAWANLYLKIQIEGVKANRTLQATRSDLQKFINFFQDYHSSLDIRRWLPRSTGRFVESLEKSGQKPKTISRVLATLRSFARWVISLRPELFPMGNPTKGTKPPTQDALRPKGLTERQVKRVLDAAFHLIGQAYPDERFASTSGPKLKRPLRDYAIIMLMLNGGLRRAEICSLNIDQLQMRHLRQVKCKGNMFRDLLLGEETIGAIKRYIDLERPLDTAVYANTRALFLPVAHRKHRNTSGRFSERSINVIVESIEAAANQGLPEEDKFDFHPHMFRHTHAYQVLKTGRSLPYVQKRLGHQSMNYLSLYTQMPESEEQDLLDEAEFK